jgi:hypothetical protein
VAALFRALWSTAIASSAEVKGARLPERIQSFIVASTSRAIAPNLILPAMNAATATSLAAL